MDDTLKGKAQDMSPFLKLEDGQPAKIDKFVSWREIPNKFKPTENTMEYTFELGGKTKTMTSSSSVLADKLASLKKGQPFFIKKEGSGFNTKWEIYDVAPNGSLKEVLKEETDKNVAESKEPHFKG